MLNEHKRVYHLGLGPGDLTQYYFLVGDPERVEQVSAYFDYVEKKIQNREFHTHIGRLGNKKISALSTGIGTDNIDIVMNELDALFRMEGGSKKIKNLNLIRIGTSGALRRELGCESVILAAIACGFDNLPHFYQYDEDLLLEDLQIQFRQQVRWPDRLPGPYFIAADQDLLDKFDSLGVRGITISAPGFYGPQARSPRLKTSIPKLLEELRPVKFNDLHFTNFEMETSALYALSGMMGHQALSICAAIANRESKTFHPDYKSFMSELISKILKLYRLE